MDLLCFCSVLCLLCFVRVCLYVLCGHLLGRADLLALVCGVYCHFPIGILGQVWYLIVSIPDLCILTYFLWRYFAFPYFVCQEPTRILYLIFYILKLLNYSTYFTGVFTFDWLQRAYNMITFLQVIIIGKLRISVW